MFSGPQGSGVAAIESTLLFMSVYCSHLNTEILQNALAASIKILVKTSRTGHFNVH